MCTQGQLPQGQRLRRLSRHRFSLSTPVRTIGSFLLPGLSPPASVGLVLLTFLPQSPSERTQASSSLLPPCRQLSGPPLSLLSFVLTQGDPSACPYMPCAPAPHSLVCPGLCPLHTHQDLSCLGETRRGSRSSGVATKMTPNQRGKWLLTGCCLLLLLQCICLFIMIILSVCCPILGRAGTQAP